MPVQRRGRKEEREGQHLRPIVADRDEAAEVVGEEHLDVEEAEAEAEAEDAVEGFEGDGDLSIVSLSCCPKVL
jgi:hypothetical protein